MSRRNDSATEAVGEKQTVALCCHQDVSYATVTTAGGRGGRAGCSVLLRHRLTAPQDSVCYPTHCPTKQLKSLFRPQRHSFGDPCISLRRVCHRSITVDPAVMKSFPALLRSVMKLRVAADSWPAGALPQSLVLTLACCFNRLHSQTPR